MERDDKVGLGRWTEMAWNPNMHEKDEQSE